MPWLQPAAYAAKQEAAALERMAYLTRVKELVAADEAARRAGPAPDGLDRCRECGQPTSPKLHEGSGFYRWVCTNEVCWLSK